MDRTCVVCGTRLFGKRSDAVYCGDKCANVVYAEKNRARVKKWRVNNREAHNALNRKWRKNHRESGNENCRRWRLLHPESTQASSAARRVAKLSGADRVPYIYRRTVMEPYSGKCVYCGAPADTMDHVEPLKLGGKHEVGNLVPACRSCNSSKHSKKLLRFLYDRRYS